MKPTKLTPHQQLQLEELLRLQIIVNDRLDAIRFIAGNEEKVTLGRKIKSEILNGIVALQNGEIDKFNVTRDKLISLGVKLK
ncbi:hypothetical protein [Algoriphagus aquimarinus]|uniref:hypothetical protein n=1 Tax=Algoriphagus aquimarinus TaxID=237018 RepID=UPI0030D8284F|tara:strand:+ start:28727 stop:28972 length:246 start_codon:yes stop_codon:yes gene_type:complete